MIRNTEIKFDRPQNEYAIEYTYGASSPNNFATIAANNEKWPPSQDIKMHVQIK